MMLYKFKPHREASHTATWKYLGQEWAVNIESPEYLVFHAESIQLLLIVFKYKVYTSE